MGRPKVARGARGRPAHPILFLFDVPSMQPWSAQSKPCEGVRASKEMNLGVTREAQGKITRLGQVHVHRLLLGADLECPQHRRLRHLDGQT